MACSLNLLTRVASKHVRVLNFYSYSSENGLFLIVFRICVIKQLVSVNDVFLRFLFLSLLFLVNKILLLEIIIERLAPYFSLVPRQ